VKYRAVFLDAGDTILSPHPSFAEVFVEVMRDHGHGLEARQVDEAFEEIAPFFVEILEKTGYTTWSTSPEISRNFWGTVYATAFEHLSIDDPGGRMASALYERFTRYESYRLFPDALPALNVMREGGLALGLISNFEEWLEGMLTDWDVAHLFDVLMISGKEGIEKPDPKMFEIAAERVGADPKHSVHVGDHPVLDVEAAESVGMTGVLIDRRGRFPDFEGKRITSLEDLPAILGLPMDGAIAQSESTDRQ
jgi:REG-2-like HAD superfamily hydrolase